MPTTSILRFLNQHKVNGAAVPLCETSRANSRVLLSPTRVNRKRRGRSRLLSMSVCLVSLFSVSPMNPMARARATPMARAPAPRRSRRLSLLPSVLLPPDLLVAPAPMPTKLRPFLRARLAPPLRLRNLPPLRPKPPRASPPSSPAMLPRNRRRCLSPLDPRAVDHPT